jgi:hypothetical protein
MRKNTKLENAKLIVTALYGLRELAKDDHPEVQRLVKHKAPALERDAVVARRVIQHNIDTDWAGVRSPRPPAEKSS